MSKKRIVQLFVVLIIIFSSLNLEAKSNVKQKPIIDEDFALKAKVNMYMKLINTPSAVACVIKENKTIWSGSYGYSNYYTRKKADFDSIYVLGSVSKIITGTAFMQLYEEGLIELDQNINDFLPFEIVNPNYPNVNITPRMLLAHRSSLNDVFRDVSKFLKYIDNRSKWIKERLLVDGELYQESYWGDYKPGERSNYSNIGLVIISYLIEIISGQDFEDYCKENIFFPLQMHNTSYRKEDLNEEQFARPYYSLFSKIFIPLPNYDIGCLSSFGGLRTSVNDLSRFLIVHTNKGVWNNVSILKETTLNEMHKIQYNNSERDFFGGIMDYGLGWFHFDFLDSSWEGCTGGAIGYNCKMVISKTDNVSIIFFTNGHFNRPIGPLTIKYAEFRFYMDYKLTKLFIEEALKKV